MTAFDSLDQQTRAQLAAYRDLLVRWNQRFNLTAIREADEVDRKLIGDALTMLPAVDDAVEAWNAGQRGMDVKSKRPRLIDVGSGAGLPGMVIKIARPAIDVTLLEATGKKAGFIDTAIKELGLSGA